MTMEENTFLIAITKIENIAPSLKKEEINKVFSYLKTHIFEHSDELTDPSNKALIKYKAEKDNFVSKKASNLFINWRKVAYIASSVTLNASTALADNFLIPFCAIIIAYEYSQNSEIDLKKEHAIVLSALWEKRERGLYVKKSAGYRNAKKKLIINCGVEIDIHDFENFINDLEAINSIEILQDYLFLKERVRLN